MLRSYRLPESVGEESKALAQKIVDLLLAEGKTFDVSAVALEEAQEIIFRTTRPVKVEIPDSAG